VVLSEEKLIALRAVLDECGFTSSDSGSKVIPVESRVVEPETFEVNFQ
jgi:hypothetical protein